MEAPLSTPFTDAVRRARDVRGETFVQLAAATGEARSAAWLTKLVGRSWWGEQRPPESATCRGFARVLGCSPQEVKEMICEEWYGVVVSRPSERVARWQSRLDALTAEDAALVDGLLVRLTGSTVEDPDLNPDLNLGPNAP